MKKTKIISPQSDPMFQTGEIEAKKKSLVNKFNLTKDSITVEDIVDLINKLNNYNTETIKEETAQLIFDLLDPNKRGSISTKEFLDEVIKRNSNDESNNNSEIDLFFIQLNLALSTTSEKIISKLKRMKGQNWLIGDNSGINDLNWIINAITEENLYDLDTSVIHSHWKNKQRHDEIAYLLKYSDLEHAAQKARDYKKIRKESKIYKSSFFNKVNGESKSNKKIIEHNLKLTEIISPSIISMLKDQMKKLDTPEFNIFELNEILDKKTSIYIAIEILRNFDVIENEVIPHNIFINFLEIIVSKYDRINAIYHNDLHAGDVMQTSYTIIKRGNLLKKMKLGQLDVFSILVACLCHDYKHPGQNNLYQINAKTKYAMRYNDISVLENYHASQTFKVLQKNEYNIFINFSPEEYRICRRRMIDGILSTDMANHQKVISAVKIKMDTFDIKNGENLEKIFSSEDEENLGKLFENQQCILNMIIHGSDISNPGKPDKISSEWTKRVYGEFFVQGDLEKKQGLTISNFCDRETTNVNKAMIGFINFVVLPAVTILVNLVNEVKIYKDYCKFNLKKHQNGLKKDEMREKAKKNLI
jgi:hypothetical protein